MKVIVFTAAVGETDTVRAPLVIDRRVRYLCFSDRPCVAPYEWIPVSADPSGREASRRVKILAEHPALRDADATLWHDASYRLQRNVRWVTRALRVADLAALHHHKRTRIEDEAVVIARYGYLPIDLAAAHVARYRGAGFLDHVITSCGLIARRHSDTVRRFNALWWGEAQQWGGRDQASVDYAAWVAGVRVTHLPGTIRHNRFAAWRERPIPVDPVERVPAEALC